MRDRMFQGMVLILAVCLLVPGCGKTRGQHVQQQNPNAAVTYEKGKDFVGVVKKVDTAGKKITFYNTGTEEERICDFSGGTEILTPNEKQISVESLEAGQVVDVYLSETTKRLIRIQLSSDILQFENAKKLLVNADEKYIELNDVRYRYGSGFSAFSEGEVIDIQEIAPTDEVTFRGVKGKAYSLVVTRGHGYIKPDKYKDFIGGTMTVGGMMILPVTENMLVPVPEGTYEVTMKNGDFSGGRSVKIERDKQLVLDMSLFKSVEKNKGQVVFNINPEGAELYVNGSPADYSKPVSLKYGKHSIKVVLDGYTTYTGVLDVQSANPTVQINLADEEAEVKGDSKDTSVSKENSSQDSQNSDKYDNLHEIKVTTPAGASVYMDGIYKGKAPCSFAKKIGTVTITLSKDGFVTKSYTVTTMDDSKDVEWSFPDLVSTAVG